MPVTHAGVFVQTPNKRPAAFTNADSANTKKPILTAGPNGTKVVAVSGTSTETANARVAQLWLTTNDSSGAHSYLLTSMNIPVNSGFDGTVAPANILSLWTNLPTDNDGQVYFLLEAGDTLEASLTTQVASGKEVAIFPVAADF